MSSGARQGVATAFATSGTGAHAMDLAPAAAVPVPDAAAHPHDPKLPLSGNHSGPSHGRKMSFGEMLTSQSSNPMRVGLPKRVASMTQQLETFVADMGGDAAIHSVLVANNGLAAVKFMRSIRSWATSNLGNSKAITLVAMATPNDIRINAEHIQLSDQFVEVPGGSNNNNYANVSLIVQVAARAGCDAVWPGWGHASENPDLPAMLAERGIRFLGPGPVAMAALGDKIGSTILAQAAGVPTLAWSGTGVAVSFAECGGTIPEEIYERACIHSVDDALDSCRSIGYPVMLKASWGGGGKGIRKVHSDDEVIAVFKQVQGEVPGSPIFAMKLAPISRHLEVQLLCDMHGNVASLKTRDCSIQRRHQKIIEEGPVTAASEEDLAHMEACARALARSVGYVGAATVEYLYLVEEKTYCFLELNPRLQVEHPVTEGITGVNIPACQLMVAMGVPLWRMPAIRSLYCQDPKGTAPFDLETAPQKPADCHVFAVRITAEDANDGFKPTCGRIDELHWRPTPEVWGYFSVQSGGGIHEYSDSQFGHLFAKGETRAAALSHMVVALDQVSVRGEIRTIVDYALDMIRNPDVTGNRIHTGWLDSRIAQKVHAGHTPWHLAVAAGAVVKASEAVAAQSAEYLLYLSKGQLPPAGISLTHFSDSLVISRDKYAVSVLRSGPENFMVQLNGTSVDVRVRKMRNGGFLMQVDGGTHVVHVEEESVGTRLMIGTSTCLLSKEVDPSRLVATSAGKLVRHLVTSGGRVGQSQPYAEVEVMKMMMPLLAPAAGVIHFKLQEGAALSPGDLIATMELDDPNTVVRAEPYKGQFPELGAPVVPSDRMDHRFETALENCRNILAGYVQNVDAVVAELVACLDSPSLALLQWQDELNIIKSRLPGSLVESLESAITPHSDEVERIEALTSAGVNVSGGASCNDMFPAQALIDTMEQALSAAPDSERKGLHAMLQPLQELTWQHVAGREEYARKVVMELLEGLLRVEEAFTPNTAAGETTEQELIDGLRKEHTADPQAVLDMVVSHQGLATKAQLALRLMSTFVLPAPAPYRPVLRRFVQLRAKGSEVLVVRGQALLEHSLMADLRVVVARALSGLDMFSHDAQVNSSLESITSPQAKATAPPPEAAATGGAYNVRRTTTAAEGLYRGLTVTAPKYGGSTLGGLGSPPAGLGALGSPPDGSPAVSRRQSSVAAQASIEARMELLVGAPAAVEDALASLVVDPSDASLQARAATTYIRRLYHPYLVRMPPSVRRHPCGTLSLVWLYDDPRTRDVGGGGGSGASHTCVGALLLLPPPPAAGAPSSSASTQVLSPQASSPPSSSYPSGGGAAAAVAGGGLSAALPHALELLQAELRSHTQALGLGPLPLSLHIAAASLEAARGTEGPAIGTSRVALDNGSTLVMRAELETIPGKRNGDRNGDGSGSAGDRAAASAEAALAAAVSSDAAFELLTTLNAASVSLLVGRPDSAQPLKAGVVWDGAQKLYRRDRFARQAEPITGCLLELPRLRQYAALQYTPSRNRQWHMYSGVERPDKRSYPLRRLFVRGLVRQLGHPALLAASYSGNGAAVATEAVRELEDGLVGILEELSRLQSSPAGAQPDPSSDSLAGRPDWTHVFISVLPALPAASSGPASMPPLLPGGVPSSSSGRGIAGMLSDAIGALGLRGGGDRAKAEADAKVASALRAAAAGLVARHMGAFRAAAVAQLELRLRPPTTGGDGGGVSGAWRVVVSLPSGHEHGEEHVEVYRESTPAFTPKSTPESTPSTPTGSTPAASGAELSFVAASASSAQQQQQQHGSCPLGPTPRALVLAAADSASAHLPPGERSLAGQPVLGPYPSLEPLQQRRFAARRHAVTYVYDFPSVFEDALRNQWSARAAAGEPGSVPPAGRLVDCEELIPVPGPGCSDFRGGCRLQRAGGRPVGLNDCGMVAWLMSLKTPECPQGRSIVAVANDITFQSGAFSPREDAVFRAASELSLDLHLPLVYLAANSGARVGLANEVRERLRVEWSVPEDPARGVRHLYLTPDGHQELKAMADESGQALAVVAVPQPSPDGSGATQYVLQDVIGLEDGLGVECLSGSGAIAAAYAKAFRNGYTITLVSGRTVGIGAYLARLGRRCVQRSDQPIILTGFSALNKLLGREVYTSQMQLGGPRVMGHNGVSHHVVRDDLEGVSTVLRLLSFAPATIGAPPPLLPSCDPVTRAIGYTPGAGEKLDPRAAIAGCFAVSLVPDAPQSLPGNQSTAGWQSGLFDRNSWVESHAGWAGTVVTGRARLGGQPVGVIAVETAITTRHQPADPGMPDSSEQNIPQAGQVWYPDSAQKTALAMEEFGLEGLPLFVLANWRGFSGGQRDLFEGVLQAGSLIVEELRTYRQPVFVYLPANAELRGGAWVVVDSQINAACVEMYADPTARGGVLEPAGVVEIKFRKPDLLRMMGRLDPQLQRARAEGDAAGAAQREKALLPVYQQVARQFADMHDTPQRMLAKGVIRSIVPWRVARAFFGMRLRRRMMEETLANHIQSTDATIERADALSLVRSWHTSSKSSPDTWATSAGPTSPDPVLRHTTPPTALGQQSGAGAGVMPMLPAGSDPSSLFAVQMAADAEFLAWAESSGRTLIAQELRQLRSRAAACSVHQVLGTAEGREGLLATLTAAVRKDAVLAMQLRMALAEATEGGADEGVASGRGNLTVNTSGGSSGL